MKSFLFAVFFLVMFVNYAYGQGDPPAGDPPAEDPPAGDPSSNPDAGIDPQKGIDIEAIKCLCALKVNADNDGNADANAGGGAECGLGDPAPKLSIDCGTILDGDIEGAFFYILAVERNSILGGGSWVTFDRKGYEITALNFPKGLSKSNDLTIIAGNLTPKKNWRSIIYSLEERKSKTLSLCTNDQKPGTWEYNLVEMSNQIILDGQGCPLEKGAKTSVEPNPPSPIAPAIYQFPERLPCERLMWDVKMNDPDNRMAFQVWYDFTPAGLCKPSPPAGN
ncbi:uncharacterized protein LOC107039315 [Diachasma alloeum]|uniref:uncharacterized protein LOC107039315 n=1 Tax=Diachasma alloeum TaxID=454923 RepID=UPI000738460F|nr:uncharacterized protein LOC107039315 [Diachasma alloeum]